MSRRDEKESIRFSLVDPVTVCHQLGLGEGAQSQARGLMILCPWHPDGTPSCSVRSTPDGILAVHCFGCGARGDVFTLVAAAFGLDPRLDFPRVLRRAAEIAGLSVESNSASPISVPPRTGAEVARPYPPTGEVTEFWNSSRPVGGAPAAARWLASRALDIGAVEDFDLARALPLDSLLPHWARYRGLTWADTGHSLVVPVVDAAGVIRSLRARRVRDGDSPKSLPPSGYRVSGLVMADSRGRKLLATGMRPDELPVSEPLRVVVSEGEPDFLTWATRFADSDVAVPAVFGVVSGSWSQSIAGRIPGGSRVTVRTHLDEAGERYAGAIEASLRGRCTVLRAGRRCPP
jgi:hypothetical protein